MRVLLARTYQIRDYIVSIVKLDGLGFYLGGEIYPGPLMFLSRRRTFRGGLRFNLGGEILV